MQRRRGHDDISSLLMAPPGAIFIVSRATPCPTMKEYLLMIAISAFVAHNVGTAYGELSNSLLGSLTAQLEQVAHLPHGVR
jgi:hypothetical protein